VAVSTNSHARPDLPDIARRMRSGFAGASFLACGLDERWQGTRWFGGSGGSGHEIDRIELAHGENPWDDEVAQIRVKKIRPRKIAEDESHNIAMELHSFTRQQLNQFWMSTGTLPDEVRRAAFEPGVMPANPTAPWDDVQIPVDGEAITFRILAHEEFWVAQARRAGMLVGVEARAWPPDRTGLVTIEDLAAYHAGSELIAGRGRSRFA
jgi:hypothetical protein